MEDKKKMILLAVAGLCIVGAGVLLYMNMQDTGPKPKPPPPIEQLFKDNPEVKKGYDQQLMIEKKNEAAGHKPAGG